MSTLNYNKATPPPTIKRMTFKYDDYSELYKDSAPNAAKRLNS